MKSKKEVDFKKVSKETQKEYEVKVLQNGEMYGSCPYCKNVNILGFEISFVELITNEQPKEVYQCLRCRKVFALRSRGFYVDKLTINESKKIKPNDLCYID